MNSPGKIIYIVALVLVTSFFFFPVAFIFLPPNLNTKMILAVVGLVIFTFRSLGTSSQGITVRLAGAFALACAFSFFCFFSEVINGTGDTTYATYFMSFLTWLFGGFAVCACIKGAHGIVTLRLVTAYLAAVAVFQCATALLIDNVQVFSNFVDRIFDLGQEYCRQKRRLYGLGAALDPAGVRFSIITILISHVLASNEDVRHSFWSMVFYIVSFLFVVVVGNMISRTTTVGAAMGLVYLLTYSFFHRHEVREPSSMKWIFIGLIGVGLAIVIPLYNSSPSFHSDMRFAFEGFFNWVETGVWHTSSTDKLNAVMWVWPETTDAWIFGTGWFGNWIYSTDIGYCRFILYCGLLGFSVFCIFFLYNAVSFAKEHPDCKMLALFLLALTFVIWIKVSTDIFLIYALLYHLDPYEEYDEDEDEELEGALTEELPEPIG